MASKKPVTKLKKDRGETILVAVGDVVISRTTPGEAFARVLDELKAGAFSCCNFEVPLSNKGMPQYGKFETLHAAPEMIEGFVHGGFKVMSLANNHSMDYGPEALLDTIALIDSRGILHACDCLFVAISYSYVNTPIWVTLDMGVIVYLALAATVPVKWASLLMCHSENSDFVWSERVNQ